MAVDENQCAGVQQDGPASCRIRDVDVPEVDGMAGQFAEVLDDDAARLVVSVDKDPDALIDGDGIVAVSALRS